MMQRPTISVCICTYRRPAQLARLLASLRALSSGSPTREIVVVDNDERRSARGVVDAFLADGTDVRYLVEPVRNIARARNVSVAAARGEIVAFIDDDEEATPEWLTEHWRAMQRHDVDGTVGTVVPRFDPATPRWLRQGGFFDHSLPPPGTALEWFETRTSNACVRTGPLRCFAGPFDESIGLMGGSDVDLFHRMIRRGHRFIAVPSARVREALPLRKSTARWLVQRHFRNGMTITRILRREMTRGRSGAYLLGSFRKALTSGIRGVVLYPGSKARGLARILQSAESLGKVVSMFGFNYEEYRSVMHE